MKNTKLEALTIFTSLLRDETPAIPIQQKHELFLFSWCQEHSVAGFLNKHREHYFSKDLASFIFSAHKANVQRNLLFLEEYQKLHTACIKKSLPPPVALKGLALLNRIHSLGERSLTDIDIYYPQTKQPEFENILLANHFTLVHEKKWRANQHKSIYTKSVLGLDVTLEVHHKLFYNQPDDFEPELLTLGAFTLLAPSIELVYLSAHLVHQHTFLKLFWLLDLHQLSRKNPKLWNDDVWALAKKLRVITSLGAVGFCLNQLLGHQVRLKNKFLPMKFCLNWPTLILVSESRFKYLYMKHTSKDTFSESLVYDLRWLYFRMEKVLWTNNKNNDAAL